MKLLIEKQYQYYEMLQIEKDMRNRQKASVRIDDKKYDGPIGIDFSNNTGEI